MVFYYKVLYNKERDDKYINAVLEFEKEFPNFKENGEKLLKIREKYLYLASLCYRFEGVR